MKTIAVETMNIYTVADVAEALGKSTSNVWKAVYVRRSMPEPNYRYGMKCYYTEAEFKKIIKQLRKAE